MKHRNNQLVGGGEHFTECPEKRRANCQTEHKKSYAAVLTTRTDGVSGDQRGNATEAGGRHSRFLHKDLKALRAANEARCLGFAPNASHVDAPDSPRHIIAI